MNILFNWIPAFAGTTNKMNTTAMDGGSANYAGAVICLPLMDGGSANYAGAVICLPLMDGGSANNASLHGCSLVEEQLFARTSQWCFPDPHIENTKMSATLTV